MTPTDLTRTLAGCAAVLTFALLASPSHASPPAAQPASAAAPAAMHRAAPPAPTAKPKSDGASPKMPLAPHAGVQGAERLGASERPQRPAKLVDINSASIAELKTLPGVGDAEAQRIVAGRPYRVKTDLVEKNVLLTGPFVSLRHHVVAVPPPGALGAGKIKSANKSGHNSTSAKPASASRPASGKA